MYKLEKTFFGNPILREPARHLTVEEIKSAEIQQLLKDMFEYMDAHPAFGVGIAAPQLNVPLAISVITIKPTDYRPDTDEVRMAIINPEIVQCYGRTTAMWEGCLSLGFKEGDEEQDFPYAQARRYKKIRLRYIDEAGQQQERDFDGLLAHVIQHETDHLNGILFVDRVKNTRSYMMKSEYVARHRKK